MSDGGKKTWKLTARLLKKGVTVDQALKDDHGLTEGKWNGVDGARLFSGTAYAGEAKWKKLLADGATNLGRLTNRGAVALLFLPVKKRLMVVTFGMGHVFLSPDSFERDFGLKVVLNTVERDKLKSVDVRTPEELTVQKRVQTSRQSEVSAFGIDVERDILRNVTGKPKDTSFASEVTGADSLAIHSKLDAADIYKKCESILAAYNKTDYRKEFGWVDHIRSVRDPALETRLSRELFKALEAARKIGSDPHLHLAPPEIVDHARFGRVKYAGFRSRTDFGMLDITDYLAELNSHGNDDDIDKIRKDHRVTEAAEGSDEFHRKWKLYDCLVFEVELDGKVYVLSAGQWYEISKGFAEEVDRFFRGVPSTLALPDADADDNEKTYNDALAAKIRGLVRVDPDTIACPGWNSPIEPCDFYSRDKKFIHIKHEASSSKLSHLFQQGVVSAEAFRREREFRRKLKDLVVARDAGIGGTLPDPDVKPGTDEFEAVFAVIRKPYADGSMGLPFFSKVTLRNAARHLQDFGYRVSFSWIKKAPAAEADEAEVA